MPILPNPDILVMWPHQANVPAPGMSVSVQLQADGSDPELDLNAKLQELIDYLQAWPGRLPGGNVTGSIYDVKLYAMTATELDPVEPPPEDPDPLDTP
jgi:hypothetical protein